MTGAVVRRPASTVLPGLRADRLPWRSRLLLAVLAVVGFGILLVALSPAARADEDPGRSAEATGHAVQADEPATGDPWAEPPADTWADTPPASEPDADPTSEPDAAP